MLCYDNCPSVTVYIPQNNIFLFSGVKPDTSKKKFCIKKLNMDDDDFANCKFASCRNLTPAARKYEEKNLGCIP